ncbi:MAG: 3'-5' exonuclease [bacterium]
MNKSPHIIFLDTETTGNEPEKDFLCQLAYKSASETFCELFKPPVSIPPEASAITHITNKMVADKPAFKKANTMPQSKLSSKILLPSWWPTMPNSTSPS